MRKLSVNLNKVAWIRNARDGDVPSVLAAMKSVLAAGAHGVTVHPRPDERHIRQADVNDIADLWGRHYRALGIEFNIEGYPDDAWVDLVTRTKPTQATIVPDSPEQRTSDHGWNFARPPLDLSPLVKKFNGFGIRVAVFVDAHDDAVRGAHAVGADRIELYTGPYAAAFQNKNGQAALAPYMAAHNLAVELGLGINIGHDLTHKNLPLLVRHLPKTAEASIGHALIAQSLWWGFRRTVKAYLKALNDG